MSDLPRKEEKGEKKESLDSETGNEAANGKWHSATEMEIKALLRSIKNLCVTILSVAAFFRQSPRVVRKLHP